MMRQLLLPHIGSTFWKSPSRKLFAISKRNYTDQLRDHTAGQKRSVGVSEPEEDEDDAYVRPPKRRAADCLEMKVDTILYEMNTIKSVFDETMLLAKDSKIPPGLRKALRDTFKCRICLNSINPPVVIMKCCRIILGCEACVNGWFTGEDALLKPCPSCKSERGYTETMVLRGMDEFLEGLVKCNLEPAEREQQPPEAP